MLNYYQPETRVVLRREMIVNESGFGNGTALVDEQDKIGDPAAGSGTRPESAFFGGWTNWAYPMHLIVDLGATYRLTSLWLYNETGESEIAVSTGTPRQWLPTTFKRTGYRQWQRVPTKGTLTTRFLRLTINGPTMLPELAVYGIKVGGPVAKPVRSSPRRPAPTMDQLIGTNAFIDDPIELIVPAVSFVREYHNWSWDREAPDGQLRFQPSGAAGGKLWYFDNFYQGLQKRGVTVSPAIQGVAPSLFPGLASEAKPVSVGANPEKPASYALHAAHFYQYAARYGHNPTVPEKTLTLAPDQPKRRGLGVLNYLENWNEPNKTWRGREGRFNPFELAAMCFADRSAARSADPKMRLVMGGLVGPSVEYLRAMQLWADFFASGDFPADVINVHTYISDGDDEQGFKPNGTGVAPEIGKLREKLAEVVAWRDANAPEREVWLTEFGYDTNPGSPVHAPKLGSLSAEEVQGAWLVRSYFALAAAGVDRAAMFMFRDVKSGGTGVFETCGLVTEKGQWKPKPSYYYLATLKSRLQGMRFDGSVPSGRDDVMIYRFVGARKQTAYALWCPTSEDKKVASYSFALPPNTTAATQILLQNGARTGVAQPLRVKAGHVSVTVGEVPLLITTP